MGNLGNCLMKIKLYIAIIFISLCGNAVLAENIISQGQSPDKTIALDLVLENNTLFYQVTKNSDVVVQKSKLGIETSLEDFSTGLTFQSTSTNQIDETYTLPSGKRSAYSNKCNEIRTVFSKSGKNIEIVFRVYNDGVAFRYVLQGSGNVSIISEQSECVIPEKKKIYTQTYSKDYKESFQETDWDIISCLSYSALPALVETSNSYVLLSEAMVNGNYAGAKLSADENTNAFVYQTSGTINTSLPFKSPWRTLTIGSLETIVETIMFENLNDAASISDISWVKPGRAAWSYGGEDTSGYLDFDNIKKYIDWANEMGWEYFTLDKGWQNNSSISLSQVVNYAIPKGVGVFIWVNQHSLPATETDLRKMLANWKSQSVKGLVVDFWEDDSQEMMKKYDLLLKLASEQKLLLNFRSCTKPNGLRRTWPHLLTSEAVSGNVYYARNPELISSSHNINSAIIRNSLGATDYAPIDFAEKNGRVLQATTWAHQLALSVVFESGVQHIMDAPDNLKYNISKDFLKTLPAAWDDTKCLNAELGNYVCIARRKNNDWHIASLTTEAGTAGIPLSFLSEGKKYNAYIYKDGGCPSEIDFEYKADLSSADKITVPMLKNGGLAILLSESSNHAKPLHLTYEAESEDNLIPFGVSVKTDNDSLCSAGKYVAGIGKGRALTFQKITVPETGTYALTFYFTADSHNTAYIKVNEKNATWREYSFIATGKESGGGLAHKTIFVELESGMENTIEFGNNSDYAPNLDRITLYKYGNESTDIEQIEDNKIKADIFTKDKTIVIEQQNETGCYAIYNSLGQLFAEGRFNGIISIPVANSGIYVVKLYSEILNCSEKVIIK